MVGQSVPAVASSGSSEEDGSLPLEMMEKKA